MSEIERIQKYVQKTGFNFAKYPLSTPETFAIWNEMKGSPIEMIYLAFNYGRAKGFRAAKAEGKRHE